MNKTFLLFLISISFLSHAQTWRLYGFDDVVAIKVLQQPTVMDTLGQRILVSNTENGRMLVLRAEDPGTFITDKENVHQFYDQFLTGYARTSRQEILSQHYDTLRGFHSMTFTVRVKDTEVVGICKLVWLDHKAFVFQYLYNESNPGNALQEADIFFNSIRFSMRGYGQFSDTALYGKIGLGILILFILGAIGALVAIVYAVRNRRKRT
jgi:hypothetical protein